MRDDINTKLNMEVNMPAGGGSRDNALDSQWIYKGVQIQQAQFFYSTDLYSVEWLFNIFCEKSNSETDGFKSLLDKLYKQLVI